ncbi:hypothetical protein ACFWMH_29565 [Streptomyces tendae]|uniref:hypothetical protein n=1 Tax=Streptomyces tendae TaxID=1932 RepID=UPI0036658028
MRLTMPIAVVEGTQLTVMPFRDDAVVGTMAVPALVQLVPSPRAEEDPRKLRRRRAWCVGTPSCAPPCSAR